MTDYDNKDLNGQAEPQPEAPSAPQLTLEPDPVPPEVPETPAEQAAPQSSTESFHMPDPPKAPEPPRAEPVPPQQPQYNYQQTPPQYSAPQYGQPQYQAPYQPQQQNYKPLYNTPPAGYQQKSRLAAGILAILLGTYGVHNYYLGYNTRGTIQLVVALAGGLITCGVATAAVGIWGFVEGILLFTAGPSNPTRLYDGNGVIMKD